MRLPVAVRRLFRYFPSQMIRPSLRIEPVVRNLLLFAHLFKDAEITPDARNHTDDGQKKRPEEHGLKRVPVFVNGHLAAFAAFFLDVALQFLREKNKHSHGHVVAAVPLRNPAFAVAVVRFLCMHQADDGAHNILNDSPRPLKRVV